MLVRCTCLRGEGLKRLVVDPGCPAPSHLYDEVDEIVVDVPLD
jgi:hypothetical protein